MGGERERKEESGGGRVVGREVVQPERGGETQGRV